MKSVFVVASVVLLACAAIVNTASEAAAAHPVGPATGNDADNKPNSATEIETVVGTPGPGSPDGIVAFTFENRTGKPLTDIHLRNPQRFVQAPSPGEWVGVDFNPNFEQNGIHTTVVDGGNGSKMTGTPGTKSGVNASTYGDPGGGNGTLETDKKLQVSFQLYYPNSNVPLPPDTPVKFEVIGTHGGSTNNKNGVWVSATGVNAIGGSSPPTEVASLGIPDYLTGTVATGSEDSVTLRDIPLAEMCGYRFNNGNLVIKPMQNTRFALEEDDTHVLVYNELGETAGGNVVGVSNLRINDAGHLVMDVTRNKRDENHIVIVIRGLKLESFSHLANGDEIYATGYGAAIPAGGVLENNWKVAVKGAS
jgi:hypothetical protein